MGGVAERGELLADRYELTTRLGRGGAGEVWAARDRRLHRDVAVKIFEGGAGGELPAWLRHEGVTAAQISHPNVVTVHDQGTDDSGRLYLVMELVTGASLTAVLRSGPLPLRDALSVAAQVCEALAAAHAAGVVHRDVKPRNILVRADGVVKVVDFGISGYLNDTRSWSSARAAEVIKGSGSPDFAAPEQVLGGRADARSDLYAVGTLLFVMLAGRTPFVAENFLAVMRAKVTTEPPDVGELRAGVPEAVAGLVRQLLARGPEARPGSAAEVAARLRAVLFGLDGPDSSHSEVEVEGQAEVESEGDAGAVTAGEADEAAPTADSGADRVESSTDDAPIGPAADPEAAVGVLDAEPEPWVPLPEQRDDEPAPGAATAGAATSSTPDSAGSASTAAEASAPAPKPVWGVAADPSATEADAAATSGTRLSALAPVVIRGRSLLPPVPGSVPHPAAAHQAQPIGTAPPASRRRTLTRIVAVLLIIGLGVAVALAISRG